MFLRDVPSTPDHDISSSITSTFQHFITSQSGMRFLIVSHVSVASESLPWHFWHFRHVLRDSSQLPCNICVQVGITRANPAITCFRAVFSPQGESAVSRNSGNSHTVHIFTSCLSVNHGVISARWSAGAQPAGMRGIFHTLPYACDSSLALSLFLSLVVLLTFTALFFQRLIPDPSQDRDRSLLWPLTSVRKGAVWVPLTLILDQSRA